MSAWNTRDTSKEIALANEEDKDISFKYLQEGLKSQ
jgi:hypothetical protein